MNEKLSVANFAGQTNVSSDKMDALNTACEKLMNENKEIERITALLKAANERKTFIESVEIPDIMDSMNLETFTLRGGKKVTVKRDVHAHITEENKPAAYAWLEENEHGDLIKTEVSVKFNREDHELATQVAEELSARELDVSQKNAVHAGTLKVFVREQLEEGKEVPTELFGVMFTRKATIK